MTITVTAAIIEKDGFFLAARRKQGLHMEGFWEFPGGKLERNESPKDCLKRELFEEFGITARVVRYFGECRFDYPDKSIRLLAFLTEHKTGEFQLREHDALQWLRIEDLKTVSWAPADIPLVEKLIAKRAYSRTMHYYGNNAQEYIAETLGYDMENVISSFLSRMPDEGHILDIGCGAGRDAKIFLEQGYQVTAIDSSPELAAITSRFLNQKVMVKRAEEIDEENCYDGIWACASLLHMPKSDLPLTLLKIAFALKPAGVLYFSLKKGTDEKFDHKDRFFSHYTVEELKPILNNLPRLHQTEISETTSLLQGKPQNWINVFSVKR